MTNQSCPACPLPRQLAYCDGRRMISSRNSEEANRISCRFPLGSGCRDAFKHCFSSLVLEFAANSTTCDEVDQQLCARARNTASARRRRRPRASAMSCDHVHQPMLIPNLCICAYVCVGVVFPRFCPRASLDMERCREDWRDLCARMPHTYRLSVNIFSAPSPFPSPPVLCLPRGGNWFGADTGYTPTSIHDWSYIFSLRPS